MRNYNFTSEQRLSRDRINEVIDAIEAKGIDLTDTYDKWLRIGMAIAHDFGEDGRVLFHRVSRTYSKYDYVETEKKYDNFLKSQPKGSTATCATLFYYAKQAGIELKNYTLPVNFDAVAAERPIEEDSPVDEDDDQMEEMPEWIFDKLPPIIKEAVNSGRTQQEKEMLLLGSITAFSAVLPMFYGVYGNKKLSPNLYFYAVGEASSGKGTLEFCRSLVDNIHQDELAVFRRQYANYKEQLNYFMSNKKKEGTTEPEEPKLRMLIMPANTTATSLYQHIAANNKGLIMIDTEGDTMLSAFKSDKGNYSEGLRKAFHNEEISYTRRTDNEYVSSRRPRLSVILSGTPVQAFNLFPSVENGLFSRFMFYHLPLGKEWRDEITPLGENPMEDCFAHAGQEFYKLYAKLISDKVLYRFFITDEQRDKFNAMFSELKPQFINIYDNDISSSIHRAGVMFFRMAMIMTALRSGENGAMQIQEQKEVMHEKFVDLNGGGIPATSGESTYEEMVRYVPCEDADFEIVCEIMKVVLQHIARVYQQIPKQQQTHKQLYLDRYRIWYNKLGDTFTKDELMSMSKLCNISKATQNRQIAKLLKDGFIIRNDDKSYKKKAKTYPYVIKEELGK